MNDKETNYKDSLIRGTAAGGQIRAFVCSTRDAVDTARKKHHTFPVCTAALGRLMSGALMLAADMKGENDKLTLTIKGDGPIKGLTVIADSHGNVKGFSAVPSVLLPLNSIGHLDVGGAVGEGTLSVIKDLGLKEPFVGQTRLQTGEIAEDLTYYLAVSEQVPSSVGLGVLVDRDGSVLQSGGFIVQLMPGASEETISALENKLSTLPSVTNMLKDGLTPEQIFMLILGDMQPEIMDSIPVQFHCSCSRERVQKALISIGRKELQSLIDDKKPQDVFCDYCETHYTFTTNDLEALLSQC